MESKDTNLNYVNGPAVDVGLVLLRVALPRLDARDHLLTKFVRKSVSISGMGYSKLVTNKEACKQKECIVHWVSGTSC